MTDTPVARALEPPATADTQEPPHPAAAAPLSRALLPLSRALLEAGVDTVFVCTADPGRCVGEALSAERRLRRAALASERAAIHAADGHARASGRVAAAVVGQAGVAAAMPRTGEL